MDVEMIACACGCGGLLAAFDKKGRPRRFLPSHWSRTQPHGDREAQKASRAAYSKKYHQEHREAIRDGKRVWRERNPEKVAAKQQRSKDQKWVTKCQRLKLYGVNHERYLAMMGAQANCCALCGVFREVLDVDHCHETGQVRELLCRQCNVGLGAFKENIEVMEKAIAYLRRHCGEQSVDP